MRLRRTAAAGVLSTAVFSALFIGTAQAADDKNCADFASQADAQANLVADPSDEDRLDADNDGQACEDFTYAAGTATSTQNQAQIAARPSGAVAAGDGSASGDSSVLPYVLGGVALTAAGGAAVAARRSSRVTA